MKIKHQPPYGELRKAAYPPIGDQLDVLWKVLGQDPSGLPPEAQALLAKVQAVKAQYPKPS